MGVLNITPNSFSDGGLSYQQKELAKRVTELLKLRIDILDVGAESTAPFNEPINCDVEQARLENFVRCYRNHHFDCIVSLDSYHVDTAKWFFKELKLRKGIWNDVSGKFDDEVINVIKEYPDLSYVWCHNNSPCRSLSSHHMDYVSDEPIMEQMASFFKDLDDKDHDKIIIDPCFGFSKNFEQNWQLLKNIDELKSMFSKNQMIIGISKKSFLRKKLTNHGFNDLSKDEIMSYSELLHYDLIKKCLKMRDFGFIFRVHDPMLYHLASLE